MGNRRVGVWKHRVPQNRRLAELEHLLVVVGGGVALSEVDCWSPAEVMIPLKFSAFSPPPSLGLPQSRRHFTPLICVGRHPSLAPGSPHSGSWEVVEAHPGLEKELSPGC